MTPSLLTKTIRDFPKTDYKNNLKDYKPNDFIKEFMKQMIEAYL